jgi:hypothetical protein
LATPLQVAQFSEDRMPVETVSFTGAFHLQEQRAGELRQRRLALRFLE